LNITELVKQTKRRETRLRIEANLTLYAPFHIFDDPIAKFTCRLQEIL